MALRFRSRIDRRQVVLGMLAAGGAGALPGEVSAVPASDAPKAYAAFFLGLGDYLFSWGIPVLASKARRLGLATDVFKFTEVEPARTNILLRRKNGYKIALVGFSLGNTAATYLQTRLPVDLLLAISESSLGDNHPIKKENTKRSVLWCGPDLLSNAGVHDGFDEINYIESLHLMIPLDRRVVNGVLDELKGLVAPARHDEPAVVANASVRKPIGPPIDAKIVTTPAPSQPTSAGWRSPTHAIIPDVTCTECWGFTQSLGAASPDPGIQ
jgi:hypothetical protein